MSKKTMVIYHSEKFKKEVNDLVLKGDEIIEYGDTGESDGAHIHLYVLKGWHYVVPGSSQYLFDNDLVDQNQTELFIDNDLVQNGIIVNTPFMDHDYELIYNRPHPAVDCVNLDRMKRKVFWNRSFTGRVVYQGFHMERGNVIMIIYETLDDHIKTVPEELKKIDMVVTEGLYHMVNASKTPRTVFFPAKDISPGKNYRYMKIHPHNFGILKKQATIDNAEYFGANGTFFWHDATGILYPTSILVTKNKVHQENANHLYTFGCPQSVLCYMRDGSFDIKQLYSAKELFEQHDLNRESKVWWAIGGVGLLPWYESDKEGFTSGKGLDGKHYNYSDVLRKTSHISIGVTSDEYILLVRHWDSTAEECGKHLEELGCLMGVLLDGGGSTQMQTPAWSRLSKENRKVDHLLVAIDFKK